MKILILGNGIAGVSAARYIRKFSDHSISIISEENPHFFSRTALMYVYMGHLRFQDLKPYEDAFWGKNKIHLIQTKITEVQFEEKRLIDNKGDTFTYDVLILATGSKTSFYNWPGQDLKGVSGLYYKQDLEYLEAWTSNIKQAVITGGGLIGIELAEMLHSRHIPVHLLVRDESYWNNILPQEESQMINRHILEHGIHLLCNDSIVSIEGQAGKVSNVMTQQGQNIPCQFVGICTGVKPNIEFLTHSGLEIHKGILVNEFLETNQDQVYAIGDCAEIKSPRTGRKAIEAIWYTGRMMGETVAHTICKSRTAYDPGVWFNSAKFFDIEYQVYGQIQATRNAQTQTVYWEHPSGKKSVRIDYDGITNSVLGFNLMGTRFRHETCEAWIKSKTNISEVIKQLPSAYFDPEFSGIPIQLNLESQLKK